MESSSQARRLLRKTGRLVPSDSRLACNTQLLSVRSFAPGLADMSLMPHRPAFGEHTRGRGAPHGDAAPCSPRNDPLPWARRESARSRGVRSCDPRNDPIKQEPSSCPFCRTGCLSFAPGPLAGGWQSWGPIQEVLAPEQSQHRPALTLGRDHPADRSPRTEGGAYRARRRRCVLTESAGRETQPGAGAEAATASVLQHSVNARPSPGALRELSLPTLTLALTGRSFPFHL